MPFQSEEADADVDYYCVSSFLASVMEMCTFAFSSSSAAVLLVVCQKLLLIWFHLHGRDEELLGQGLELNDGMQSVLAKHDAIASGSPLPTPITSISIQSSETHHSSRKPAETPSPTTIANGSPSAPALPVIGNQIDEEEEEEDDFALLARR